MPEVRFDVDPDELEVITGYCTASGIDRSKVLRIILKQWSDQKEHESIVICRMKRINALDPALDRHATANPAL